MNIPNETNQGFPAENREAFFSGEELFLLNAAVVGPTAWRNLEKRNIRIAVLLWIATALSCTVAGYLWQAEFLQQTTGRSHFEDIYVNPLALLRGLPYAAALVLILGCHEMGHFLACRRYGIWATPPFALPLPLPFLPSFGTLGAFIKIRQPFLNRNRLFDIGVAGPLAGFCAIVPVFFLAIFLSQPMSGEYARQLAQPQEGEVLYFGECLLVKLVTALLPGGQVLVPHPLYWAAIFGFLATSLNLLPVGQLDGGHIVYAVFGPRVHKWVSRATFAALIGISFLAWPAVSYLSFAVILLFLRFRHPPPLLDGPLTGKGRRVLAACALAVFLLTFLPVPISF